MTQHRLGESITEPTETARPRPGGEPCGPGAHLEPAGDPANATLAGQEDNAASPRPVIKLHGIWFQFEDQPPLFRNLDLHLGPGEKLGMIGPNGSGKTTLLLLLMGLLRPQKGTIEILGRARKTPADFADLPGKLGLLFQDSDDQLFCPTVAEDVAFGPFNQGKSVSEVRQIVRETLAELGLAGWENRITYRLSGGEKRLVALATVLAMGPQILLLDEPTSGLDEAAARRVEAILARLGQSMIVVSHDRDFLKRLCHRILLLQNGTLQPAQV